MYRSDETSFKSKLDLDYDSFVKKKIIRCEICENIYYASSSCLHNCMTKKDNSVVSSNYNKINDVVMNNNVNNINMEKDKSDLLKSGKLTIINNIRFYDEIYSIWKKKGFKRHRKLDIKENSKYQPLQTNNNPQTEKFSFSPYDNFF